MGGECSDGLEKEISVILLRLSCLGFVCSTWCENSSIYIIMICLFFLVFCWWWELGLGQNEKDADIVRSEEYLGESVLDFIINCRTAGGWFWKKCPSRCPSRLTRMQVEPFVEVQSIRKRLGLGWQWKSRANTFKLSRRECQVYWYLSLSFKKIIVGDQNK